MATEAQGDIQLGGLSAFYDLVALAPPAAGALNLNAPQETVVVSLDQNVTAITMPAGVTGRALNKRIVFVQTGAGNFTVAGWAAAGVAVEGNAPEPALATGAGAVTEIILTNVHNQGWRMYIDTSGSATYGEANTAANIGSGSGIYEGKSGVQLRFKSLKAGAGVTLTPDADSITISADGGGGGGSGDVVSTSLGDMVFGTGSAPYGAPVGASLIQQSYNSVEQTIIVLGIVDFSDVASQTTGMQIGYATTSNTLVYRYYRQEPI
ncbi:hypothetical protein [Pseudomonas anguilliseptica]|uniref:Uncharacterized protein n=1 Tax=Pseudomonas anguilliseptica TaxID=53406 RepID=A0A1H5F7L7_PSEAG|nr:hypothetical protein [Pseudomonas anguilliseptica]SED99381.1 hypothetical protein SAMN05421553_3800 [Pseudomonas anguilliseptica]